MKPEATVFIVDDDRAVRDSLVLLVETEQMDVEAFACAEDFLDAYRPEKPGCLVLDINMPGMSGLELQGALAEKRLRIPIIFITGHGDVPMSVQAVRAGAVDFIEKPFDNRKLLSRIREAIARDMDIRREEARKLADATRIFAESIVETVREPLVVTDDSLCILSANQSFYTTFDVTADAVLGTLLFEIGNGELDIPALTDRLESIIPGNSELNDLEITISSRRGGNKTLLFSAGRLAQTAGQPERILLSMKDITERITMEEELRQHRDHLEDLVAVRTMELESFSYSIAHDLTTPLRAITGFSQILMEDLGGKLEPESQDMLERIAAAGKKMSRLIDEILELSRIARRELNIETVNLSALVSEITDSLKRKDPGKNVQFRISGGNVVRGDAYLLTTALEQLMDNAWKFTHNIEPAKIEFGTRKLDDEEMFYVKDNGIGFDMDYIDKLFKPFHILHSSVEPTGTGIGLTKFQRIIRRHGGHVRGESEVGGGTTIYFTLPRHQVPKQD